MEGRCARIGLMLLPPSRRRRTLVDNPRAGKQIAELALGAVSDLFHHRLGHAQNGCDVPLGEAVDAGGEDYLLLALGQRR